MKRKPKARLGAVDWLAAGLACLREEGERALTIENLCDRLGRTKGSFYHHFKSRNAFVDRLLSYWQEEFTDKFITRLESTSSPRQRLDDLRTMTLQKIDSMLERRLRVWAESDSQVAAALARVDHAREHYLRDQLSSLLPDSKDAVALARVHLATLVGTQMLFADLPAGEIEDIARWIGSAFLEPEEATSK